MTLRATFDDTSARDQGEAEEREEARARSLRALTAGVLIVAVLAIVLALQLTRAFLVPISIGILLSYVLDPVVSLLVRRGIPRSVAATLVFVAMIIALGLTGYSVSNQATALVARLPTAAQQLRAAVERRGPATPGAVAQVQQAADELRRMTTPTSPAASRQEVRKVQIEPKSFDVADYLWASSTTAAAVVADAVVIGFLAFYLLVAGDLFRRRLVEIAGPTLTKKKITLQILDDISDQISSYLFVRAVISAIVATATGLALWATGLAQPAVWGLVAGVLNVVPYVGPIAVAAAVGVAAFLQFQTLPMVALVFGLTVLIACVEAYLVTPWLTSRAAEMNPVAIFIGLAFWGWLWGVPGLLLAVPIMMILKAVGEHIDAFQPLVAMLRGRSAL
jgi:predicted PurR-regulated permease PerM